MRYFLSLLLVTSVLSPPLAAKQAVPWAQDLEQARRQAAQENKLVLLHFWSLSCAPCRKLERYVFTHPEVGRSIAENYVPVKVNVLGSPTLAQQYGVTRIPTDIFLTPDGQELWRTTSPGDAGSYINMVRRVAAYAPVTEKSPVQQLASAARQQLPAPPRGHYEARLSGYETPGSTTTNSANQPWAANQPAGPAAQLLGGPHYNGSQRPAAGPSAPTQPQSPTPSTAASPAYPARQTAPPSSVPQQPWATQPQVMANQHYQPTATTPTYGPTQSGTTTAPTPRAGTAAPPLQPPAPAAAPQPTTNPYATQGSSAGPNSRLFDAPATPPTGAAAPATQNPWAAAPAPNVAPPHNAMPPAAMTPPRPGRPTPPAAAASRAATPTHPPMAQGPPPAVPASAPLALDGYCPVSLLEAKDAQHAWVKGDPRWGAIHRGRTYLFAGPEQQKKFLANPDVYSPALSCYDAVRFVETGQLVEGHREHGVAYRGQVFLFADEASLQKFWQDPARYARIVHEAMRRNGLGNRQR